MGIVSLAPSVRQSHPVGAALTHGFSWPPLRREGRTTHGSNNLTLASNLQQLASELFAQQRLWRGDIFTNETWSPDTVNAFQAGGAGGFRVTTARWRYGGYLKPVAVSPAEHPVAANEKIISDLAFELELSFPPVALYRNTAAAAGHETRCCISLIAYPEVFEWGIFWNVHLDPQVSAVVNDRMRAASGNLALDIWVGNTDRHNGRNVILGTFSGYEAAGSFIFLDNANTLNMNGQWSGDGWKRFTPVAVPDILTQNLDKSAVVQTAQRISSLPSQTIAEIVQRIPEDYMSTQHKQTVIEGLVARALLVPGVVAQIP